VSRGLFDLSRLISLQQGRRCGGQPCDGRRREWWEKSGQDSRQVAP
jgi:hypothetical protein